MVFLFNVDGVSRCAAHTDKNQYFWPGFFMRPFGPSLVIFLRHKRQNRAKCAMARPRMNTECSLKLEWLLQAYDYVSIGGEE